MGAISALSTTGRTLKRNGVLFVAAFVVTLVNGLPSGATLVVPESVAGLASIPLSLLTFVLSPFFLGGMLSMADEGIDGVTRFETFVAGGKANYFRLLATMVLFALLVGAIAALVTIAIAVVGIFVVGFNATGAGGPMVGSGESLAVLVLLGLVGLVAVLGPVFFLQFYAPAVVISELGVVDALKRSAGVVRRNFVSTLGYSVIAALVGLLAGIVGTGVGFVSGFSAMGSMAASGPEFGYSVLAVIVFVSVVISTVISAFGSVYQVAFYEDCLDSLD